RRAGGGGPSRPPRRAGGCGVRGDPLPRTGPGYRARAAARRGAPGRRKPRRPGASRRLARAARRCSSARRRRRGGARCLGPGRRRDGAGRVLLLAVPLDALAGDFPLQPAYLPFLRRLSLHAAGHQPPPLWRTTGESGIVPEGTRDPVVVTPGGALLRPTSDSAPCVVQLGEAGFYAVHAGRAAGEPVDVIAANPPPGESDLTPADPRELLLGVSRG